MSLIKRIFSVKKYSYMLRQLVSRDFKVRYRGSILGVLWSVLNPLLYMLVLSIVFSQVFNQVDNYKIYLLSGLVFFNFFSEATNIAVTAIVGNFGLITKVYFPKFILPLSKVCSSAINLLLSLIVYFILSFCMGSKLWWGYILLPYVVICLLVFTVGISFILSALEVFLRDVQHLYSVLVTIWMYATPILYPIDQLPASVAPIIKLNPLYSFIDFLRKVTMDGVVPEAQTFILAGLWSIGVFVLGSVIFVKSQDRFIYYT